MCKEIFVSFNFRMMLFNTKYTKISTIRKLPAIRYTTHLDSVNVKWFNVYHNIMYDREYNLYAVYIKNTYDITF